MNRHAYLCAALLLAAPALGHAAVPVLGDPPGPSGADAFVDGTANWLVDTPVGAGQLSIVDQHLAYSTSTTPTSQDFAAWEWNVYGRPDGADWTFQMDVSMPQLSFTNSSQFVIYGLQMPTIGGNFFFYVYETASGTQFVAQEAGQQAVLATAAPGLSALRFRFDGSTGDLFADYDLNGPAGGYQWTNLDSATSFGNGTIAVFGESANIAVSTADNVFGDNVVAVPEASSTTLMLAGLGLLTWYARKNRSSALRT